MIGQSALVTDEIEDIERERRQVCLMQERIEEFRAGSIPLARLISDLEGLLEARTRASRSWIGEFRSAWGDLEVPYAVALDRLTPIPDARDPTVADGLLALDELVASALADLAE